MKREGAGEKERWSERKREGVRNEEIRSEA